MVRSAPSALDGHEYLWILDQKEERGFEQHYGRRRRRRRRRGRRRYGSVANHLLSTLMALRAVQTEKGVGKKNSVGLADHRSCCPILLLTEMHGHA